MPNYGQAGQTGAGTIPDGIQTISGSQITGLTDNMFAWAARVARHGQSIETLCELWFYRDSIWQLCPSPIVADSRLHPVLRRKYRQPAQLRLVINNSDGYLTRTNLESPYNYDLAGNYDALVDAHRKVLLRVGCRCYGNLAAGLTATAGTAPTSGALGLLTDGLFADFTSTSPAACLWAASGTASVSLVFDLGSVQNVAHVAIRFGSANFATNPITLPACAQVFLSQDGTNYSAYPVRRVGGVGSATVAPGDWDDDPYGSATEIPFCSLNALARYVQIVVTPTGSQTWAIDEIGIWGGATSSFLGCNKFCGYLGDGISVMSEGMLSLIITDVMKKLADNNEARVTGRYGLVDLADVAYLLLTASTLWRGAEGAYDYAWQPIEIGWQSGVNLTGYTLPVWQGQGNNLLGYEYQLWNEIGWHLTADGNGVLQAAEPPYRQYRPNYVYVAAADGNQDARFFERDASDADLRNVVEISTGTVKGGLAGSLTLMEPASVARYGHLRTIITDSIATTADLRSKVASATLREYAWRLDMLYCEIAPDFDTAIKDIHAFRTGGVPNTTLGRVMLRAKSCDVVGQRCHQELWSLEVLEEHLAAGEWWGLATYRPYVPAAIYPPVVVSLTPGSGATATQMTLLWNAADDFTVSPLSGTGAVNAQSGLFTVAINGYTGTYATYVALSDGGEGGIFRSGGSTTGTLTFNGSGTAVGPEPQTFTYEPSSGYAGPRVLTLTATGSAFNSTHTVEYTSGSGVYFPPLPPDTGQFALVGFNVYLSSVGEDDPNYALQNGTLIPAYNTDGAPWTEFTLTGLTVGTQYWCYMTAVDSNGNESEPSTILSAIGGGGPGTASDWTVTDLSVAFDAVTGPDAQGYYTYQFSFLWTSPPIPAPSPDHGLYGFKRMSINYSVGALPAAPEDNPGTWLHNNGDEWAGARVPPGLMWDRATPGQLDWVSRFRTTTDLSGLTMYFRMITSSSTTSWQGTAVTRRAYTRAILRVVRCLNQSRKPGTKESRKGKQVFLFFPIFLLSCFPA